MVTREANPGTDEPDGAPHVLIVRPPGGKLTWLRALTSRRHETITTILAFFTGFLIADGYGAYQKLGSLAGVQQCCQHIIRRCRQVAGLGPGNLQSWAEEVIEILRAAHLIIQDARARSGPASAAQGLADSRRPIPRSPGTSPAVINKSSPLAKFGCETFRLFYPPISRLWRT